ncbi:DUF2177 family protein [Desulfatitalea alkaliphila]|uniref:DUF2177 family protein n=1 Tax=Desulfatitalea alkaliphila TaxID=2929485 RepID=A0AA41R7D3_9BACT|nr:DUF2177 family protein [Desulfatitalea alkaliphila]MCJ8502878.1 DUF2177 family protein [Desulfatitalea alkaliphila]
MSIVKLAAVTGSMAAGFLIVDLLWLGIFAKGFYQRQIGHLMADQVNWPAALLFYAVYMVGILFFAVLPANSIGQALLLGAALGFLAYATYDLTNWAVLKDWPPAMVAVDLVWGTVLTGLTAAIGYYVARQWPTNG